LARSAMLPVGCRPSIDAAHGKRAQRSDPTDCERRFHSTESADAQRVSAWGRRLGDGGGGIRVLPYIHPIVTSATTAPALATSPHTSQTLNSVTMAITPEAYSNHESVTRLGKSVTHTARARETDSDPARSVGLEWRDSPLEGGSPPGSRGQP
jgi:hypothetical protein